MTVIEAISKRVARLDPPQQQALLTFLDSLEIPPSAERRASRVTKARQAEIKAAIRGIAGMWKDRTDLPKDPVQAVKVLRTRMRTRGRNHG